MPIIGDENDLTESGWFNELECTLRRVKVREGWSYLTFPWYSYQYQSRYHCWYYELSYDILLHPAPSLSASYSYVQTLQLQIQTNKYMYCNSF